MKSVIDWNEIVPMLPKSMRDSLMLEAVLLLSSVRGKGNGSDKRPRAARALPPAESRLKRQWLNEGDGQVLSAPGRRYRVNKTAKRAPKRGKIGAVWAKLLASKNDAITYEGLASICKGEKVAASAVICALWEAGHIEVERVGDKVAVVEGKKIAVAY